jgi:beta-glucosidase
MQYFFRKDAMMKRKMIGLLALCMMTAVFAGCVEAQKSDLYGLAGKTHSAVTPADRANVEWWMPRHEQVLARVAQGNVDLIMVGDSITHGWENSGKAMWEQYYAPRNAVNMGFSGDRTQHVLWRIDHGEIDGISPKLAILMIGTNNSNGNDNTAEEIADGIKAICERIRTKLPKTKILILAIFPRDYSSDRQPEDQNAFFNPQWDKNNEANRLVSRIADEKMIYFLDINAFFLNENGELPRDVMPDLLHPNEKGYKIWAEAMEPMVKKLMGEK